MNASESESTPPECIECGTCCFSDLPTYVRVHGDDYERLGDRAESLVVWHATRCFMRMHEGHCGALVVDGATGRFLCSIYEQRPSTCRELERGSSGCAGERAEKGERPERALARLRLHR